MNWSALFIVAIGVAIVIVGWRGTQGDVWNVLAPASAGASVPQGVKTRIS